MRIDRIRGAFAVLSLSLLLAACEREEVQLPGEDVLVQVYLSGIAEGGAKDVTRSASMGEGKTVSMPVGGGLVLDMRMERDTSELRAAKLNLAYDSYFRVIAVKAGTMQYVAHDDFRLNYGPVNNSLHVPKNAPYDFICFSYNNYNNTLPVVSYTRGQTISGSLDAVQGGKALLYKKITNLAIGDVAPALTIELEQVVARIRVVFDFNYNQWPVTNIDGVRVGYVNSNGAIRLSDGALTSSWGDTPSATGWSGWGYEWESGAVFVMPQASNTISVQILKGAIKRSGLSDIPNISAGWFSANFTTELLKGYGYRLLLTLREPKFARSNVYWNGSALYFEPHGSTGSQGVQGVFFKWGSLIGISPAHTSGSNSFTVASTPIYKPSAVSTGAYSSYNDIPYKEYDDIDASQYGSFIGDICRYLSNDAYRLPMPAELGSETTGVADLWTWDGDREHSAAALVSPDGTSDIIALGQGWHKLGETIFPCSGYRGSNGVLGSVGIRGAYWTRVAGGYLWDYHVYYDSYRSYAYTVRCVKVS